MLLTQIKAKVDWPNYVNNIFGINQSRSVFWMNTTTLFKSKAEIRNALQSGIWKERRGTCAWCDGLGSSVSLRVDDFHFYVRWKGKIGPMETSLSFTSIHFLCWSSLKPSLISCSRLSTLTVILVLAIFPMKFAFEGSFILFYAESLVCHHSCTSLDFWSLIVRIPADWLLLTCTDGMMFLRCFSRVYVSDRNMPLPPPNYFQVRTEANGITIIREIDYDQRFGLFGDLGRRKTLGAGRRTAFFLLWVSKNFKTSDFAFEKILLFLLRKECEGRFSEINLYSDDFLLCHWIRLVWCHLAADYWD